MNTIDQAMYQMSFRRKIQYFKDKMAFMMKNQMTIFPNERNFA
jgi:hypothetical protein